MIRHRQVDLGGSITAVNAAGHRVDIRCDGARVTLDIHGFGAGLTALGTLRSARRSGGRISRYPAFAWLAARSHEFQVEVNLRGRTVGRAGLDSRPNWLGRAVTRLPIELRAGSLLRALLTSP